ncbi:MAG TPA: MASE4 domain-containing protein [Methylomirabilota bacterium]|nr:MASE4 domain-containing protein [Methylomirabilota bacterium]
MAHELPDGRRVFLSTLAAHPSERRLALAVVLVSVAIFLAAVPFAKVPLARVPAFIPIYQSALAVNDLITAVLLFGQFSFLRSRGLLVLATGYLFTALMAIAHMLTFPGLFTPSGLLGAGPQSTAWLYMFWHAGFPLLVIAYAVAEDQEHRTNPPRGRAPVAILASVAVVIAVAAGVVLLATAGQDTLPAIMQGNHYTSAMIIVVSSVWVLSLLALVVLWRRRPHSVLDLWLMVVMCAWLFDIALAAVLNAGRFDLGFYAGRLYGLLAASFVLAVLLIENGRLYFELDRQNRSLENTVRERTAQLLQSEKVATMGSLLAGVAHELNNPLAVLMGQADLLRRGAKDPALVQRAGKITAAAERCGRVVKNFLALARQRPPERGNVVLNQVVAEAVELLAYELRTDSITVSLDLADDLPPLWADAHQLHQVLVNIVANAHQAMRSSPAPREVSITTRSDPARQRVHLDLTDNGPGIPPEIRAKIFEPFFTTKPAGQGTGLGLSLCRSIVEEHGGAITVESEPGRGTTFAITLPVVPRPLDAGAPIAVEAPAPVGSKAILVVDDERDLAELLVEELEGDGHQVEIASNGADALRRLERRAFDLVVSDTKMPLMDGLELYREIERRFPALQRRIVFVTGDVLDAEKRRFLESTGAPFLTKPFDLRDVRNVVRRQLVIHGAPPLTTAGGGR